MRRGVALAGGAVVFVSLFAAARAHAAGCQGRPTDPAGFQSYSYGADVVKAFAGTTVSVHYATTGANAVDPTSTRGDGVPDTVALAADVGDKALAKYAEMGFKAPPSDASCTSNGGDGKLDVYLVAFTGADGTTIPEACTGRACSSFVLAESTFKGRGYPTVAEGFQTVVAHELFHAVQNGYDSQLDRFWAEGTAQWAMKNVYPQLVDFAQQLPAFFAEPSRSLDTQPSGVTAGYLYGSAVWPLFLTLRHGPDTVRAILEAEADGTKSLVAADAVLMTKGSSLADDYPLFGAWNAATKTLAGPDGYPDAAKYPGVNVAALADGVTAISSGLGYFAYRGTLGADASISLDTDGARNAGVAVPIEGGRPDLARAVKLPANVAAGDVLVVVAGITTKKTDAPFTLHVAAPDPGILSSSSGDGGASSSSSSGGSGGSSSSGGCAIVSGGGEGAPARERYASFGSLGIAIAAIGACVMRRRPRS
jgi:uncharacterized membrane protein YgcG